MKRFYLVARGRINPDAPSSASLISRRGFIDPDYMGAAEFEFGAIPRFYRRVMQRLYEYAIINLGETIGLYTSCDIPFWAFVNVQDIQDFTEAMKDYTDDLKARDRVRQWHLKEWTSIDEHFSSYSPGEVDFFPKKSDAWFCIDQRDRWHVGDWFMFVGDESIKEGFLTRIRQDHTDWWLVLPEDERKKDYTRW